MSDIYLIEKIFVKDSPSPHESEYFYQIVGFVQGEDRAKSIVKNNLYYKGMPQLRCFPVEEIEGDERYIQMNIQPEFVKDCTPQSSREPA